MITLRCWKHFGLLANMKSMQIGFIGFLKQVLFLTIIFQFFILIVHKNKLFIILERLTFYRYNSSTQLRSSSQDYNSSNEAISFLLTLFQRQILLLISQKLKTSEEHHLLHSRVSHHHLHFCLTCMGCHTLPHEIVQKGKGINFISEIITALIFLSIMCRKKSLVPHRIQIKLSKYNQPAVQIPLACCFYDAMKNSPFRSNEILFISTKTGSSTYRFMVRVTKEIC